MATAKPLAITWESALFLAQDAVLVGWGSQVPQVVSLQGGMYPLFTLQESAQWATQLLVHPSIVLVH
jgi:hypothetical protein